MFEFSQRVAVESHSRGIAALEQQANCLVASLNALRLVDVKYRWILIKKKKLVCWRSG
jgi:hypothetical protein